MRDLLKALETIETSQLPINRRLDLNSSNIAREKLPGGAVLLDRIDELACESLTYSSGRLVGEPDLYNAALLKHAGYEINLRGSLSAGDFEGEIVTSKGTIRFG